MHGVWRYMFVSALLTTVFLLHAVSVVVDAKPQHKLTGRRKVVGERQWGEEGHEVGRLTPLRESWAVQMSGGDHEKDAELLARKHGLTNRGQIGNLKGVYLLTVPLGEEMTTGKSLSAGHGDKISAAETAAALQVDETVVNAQWQNIQLRERRGYVLPSDPGWRMQWSLANTGQTTGPRGLDLNVEPVWMQGFNGSTIVVGVVDDGLEWTHTDLIDNFDSKASYDFVWDDGDPTPDDSNDEDNGNGHGTNCAGEIAMGRDCSCGVGVAYGCNIGGLKVDFNLMSDASEARALGHEDSYIDIYSNSWGPSDTGFSVEGPGPLVQQTLANGAREGRNGRGSIYVWASGNGGRYFDSCAADGYVNSIHTIAVGSADQEGQPADYDEACSAKMAVTFTYNSKTFPPPDEAWTPHDQVYTTSLGGECTDQFTGTSASAPLVSGVIALVLQANPELTWRDVQYLIAYTSNPDKLTVDDLATNGAGLKFSHHFGFGAIDAEAMVTRARHWINVPEQQRIHLPIQPYTKTIYTSDDVSFTVSDVAIGYLEHVVVCLTLEIHAYGTEYDYEDFYDELYSSEEGSNDIYEWLGAAHPRRGDVEIRLRSPSDTSSTLLPFRDYDFINSEGYHNWCFMSVHFWGERPTGVWTLTTSYRSSSGHITLNDISMTLYGSTEIPVSVSVPQTSCHLSCVRGCSGSGSMDCNVCKNFRVVSTLECVDECPNGTLPYNNYCINNDEEEDFDKAQCPSDEESHVNARNIGLGVVALVLLVALVVTTLGGCGFIRYKNKKNHGRFRRLPTAADV